MEKKREPYAEILGWQKDERHTDGGFDLYNIIDEDNVIGRHGSTVSLETLKKLGVKIKEKGKDEKEK